MQAPESSWGFAAEDDTRTYGPSGATWVVQPNSSWSPLNQTSLYDDFELCAKVSMDYPETSNGWVGVTFWGVDSSNNYSVDIYPKDGGIGVFRLQKGKALKPAPYQTSDAVLKDPKAVNEISVVVKGKHATVTVNGKQVVEFNGIPPEGGGLVGIDLGTGSEDSGPSSITFADFQVRALPEE